MNTDAKFFYGLIQLKVSGKFDAPSNIPATNQIFA